ncbi:hypothetical protein AB1I62_03985 [Enterococcus sp. AN402]|uniref:hypothetical protein n=1 Tax=Enterococcus sp. AN402 TaxID=3151386 RepID=UPI00345B0744
MNTKDNILLVAIVFKLLFPIAKYAYKCGIVFQVILVVIMMYLTPENSLSREILSVGVFFTKLWVIWWHIRFVIRLFKKDKKWCSIRRYLRNRKYSNTDTLTK